MAIPAIGAGARKAGSSAKSSVSKVHVDRQSRSDARNTQSGSMQRAQDARKSIRERQSTEQKNVVETLQEKAASFTSKVRAVRASWTIVMFIIPLILIQLAFGIVQIIGFGAELAGEQILWGLGAILVPGQTVFAAGLIVTILFGCASMFVAAFFYTVQGVSWWHGFSLVGFIIFTILHIMPLVNIFPWVIGWMFLVVYAQK